MSDNSSVARKRLPHLSTFEREALLELTVKYRSLVENKKTDACSSKEKMRGWQLIEGEFNSLPDTTFRSWQNLKKSWENVKHSARKASSLNKSHNLATGGGGPRREVGDAFLEKVDTLMPHINLRLGSEFDSDGYVSKGKENSGASFAIQEDADSITEMGDASMEAIALELSPEDTANCLQQEESFASIPSASKRPKTEAPREAVKKYIGIRCEEELGQAKDLHQLKMSNEREFHRRRMEHMEELHVLSLEEKKLQMMLLRKQVEK